MNPITHRARAAAVAAALLALAPAPASACGIMGLTSGRVVAMSVQELGLGIGTLVQGGISVEAAEGETCFIATDLPAGLVIDAVRFQGAAGGEFDVFEEDPEVAEKFGPGYRAWSARARTRIELEDFVIELDYTAPSPSIELPRIGDAAVDASIAMGQTDGSGSVEDHASIFEVGNVELHFAE